MDRVRNALQRIASVRELDGKIAVSLPVMYPSGATVVVEVERNDDRYWVSDMGYGLVEAEMSGAQTFYGKIASRIADDFGIGFDGNAMLALWVASPRLEAAITCVANASNRACSEAILQHRGKEQTPKREDFRPRQSCVRGALWKPLNPP